MRVCIILFYQNKQCIILYYFNTYSVVQFCIVFVFKTQEIWPGILSPNVSTRYSKVKYLKSLARLYQRLLWNISSLSGEAGLNRKWGVVVF